MKNQLIAQYEEIHRNGIYGASSARLANHVLPHVFSLSPQSVLDFGCGQSRLPEIVGRYVPRIYRYDPAIPEYSSLPKDICDLLICIDVLEHVEEAELDGVLSQMSRLARNAYLVIDTRLAKQLLPDGRNAHVTVKPAGWWLSVLSRHYRNVTQLKLQRRSNIAFRTWPVRPYENLSIVVRTHYFGMWKRLGLL